MTRTLHSLRIAAPLAALLLGARVQAAPGDIQSQQIQREEQRQQDMQQQLQPNADVRLDETAGAGVAISPVRLIRPRRKHLAFGFGRFNLPAMRPVSFLLPLGRPLPKPVSCPGSVWVHKASTALWCWRRTR